MSEDAVAIAGARGVLRGVWHRTSAARETAVFLQGYFSSTHVGPARLYVQMARALAAMAIDAVRVDPHGVGDSDGEFTETTYASELEDYRAIIAHVRARDPSTKVALVGHSIGASMAVRIAAQDREIARLVLVSPTCGPVSRIDNMFSPHERAELAGAGVTERKATVIARTFVDAFEDASVYAEAGDVRCEALVFHGNHDEYCDRASADRLVRALTNARLVEVEGADHNFLKPGSRARFLEAFARLV